MLEVKHLTKVYSGKGGVEVRALDDVSVVFPEKGMVFLLGKSGSGKSTLLNVAGGLDKPDSGEIIVKGRSSMDFSSADFDSYRNTFIGFVFQEYNILNEFTIEQNIALALQLQSKPNDKAAVDALLAQVGLEGYGKRKPNTLSGGQKQRVAIARALIKQPEIIMADEPTGALDSTTGKQVLDTLKELSKEKLIIVVSHDRDFAEYYGDRIIELKDGKILSDVTKTYSTASNSTENVTLVSDDTITIKKGESITEEDVRRIAAMLRQNGGEAVITTGKRELPDVKRACKINESGTKESFKDTGPVSAASYDGTKTKFIKSHLPMSRAIKMGAGSLKTKPIRLIFTIILAVAAFVLFGVVSTFMLYDPDYSFSEGMKDAGYTSLRLDKTFVYKRISMELNTETGVEVEKNTYEDEAYTLYGASEITKKNQNGLSFAGIFTFNQNPYKSTDSMSIGLVKDGNSLSPTLDDADKSYNPVDDLTGFTDCGERYLLDNGFRITGDYPTKATEIMLSEYFAELFVLTKDNGISTKNDLIGKTVRLNGFGLNSKEFKVTGIVYTGEIPSKYDALKTAGNPNDPERKKLSESLEDYIAHGYETLVYVSEDFYETYCGNIKNDSYSGYFQTKYVKKLYLETNSSQIDYYIANPEYKGEGGNSFFYEAMVEKLGGALTFRGLDGEVITEPTLGEGEIYIPAYKYYEMLSNYLGKHSFNPKFDPDASEEIGSGDDLSKMINEYKGGDSAIIRLMERWYPVLGYRSFLYSNSFELYNSMFQKAGWPNVNEIEWYLLLLYVRNTPENASEPNAAGWATIESFATAHAQWFYGKELENQLYNEGTEERFDIEGQEDAWTTVWRLQNEDYTPGTFAEMKGKLDAFFEERGASIDVHAVCAAIPSKFNALSQEEKEYLYVYKLIDFNAQETNRAEGIDSLMLTQQDWAVFENYYEKIKSSQFYYSLILKYLDDDNNIIEINGEKAWLIIDNLRQNNYSSSEFATIKTEIGALLTERGLSTDLKNMFTFNIADAISNRLYYLDKNGNPGELTIVGYVESMNSAYYVKDSFLKNHGEEETYGSNTLYYEVNTTDYVAPADAKYNSIISLSNNSLDQISVALAAEGDVKYHIDNVVAQKLDEFLEMIGELGPIFLYVGLGVGFIAALFLLNFISVSIAAKRKDIGILRAVGARGSDVFKIFYAEAFIIAIICFILACVGSFVVCFFLNKSISEALSISLLNFGPINGALIFGISIFISLIATFFPVYFAAKKSPVESIRAL